MRRVPTGRTPKRSSLAVSDVARRTTTQERFPALLQAPRTGPADASRPGCRAGDCRPPSTSSNAERQWCTLVDDADLAQYATRLRTPRLQQPRRLGAQATGPHTAQ